MQIQRLGYQPGITDLKLQNNSIGNIVRHIANINTIGVIIAEKRGYNNSNIKYFKVKWYISPFSIGINVDWFQDITLVVL